MLTVSKPAGNLYCFSTNRRVYSFSINDAQLARFEQGSLQCRDWTFYLGFAERKVNIAAVVTMTGAKIGIQLSELVTLSGQLC